MPLRQIFPVRLLNQINIKSITRKMLVSQFNRLRNKCKTPAAAEEPIDAFEWTLRALRKIFEFNSQDIFDPNYRRGSRFVVILSLSLFLIVCYVSSIFDQQRTLFVRFGAGGLLFGAIQVRCTIFDFAKYNCKVKCFRFERPITCRQHSNSSFWVIFNMFFKSLISSEKFIRKIAKQPANTMAYVRDTGESVKIYSNLVLVCS